MWPPGGCGVGGVQAVDVRQEDEHIGVDAPCHDGGECIVVADDDLVGGDGVVLVDDGQCPQLQQTVQGVGKVETPGIVGSIVAGDQQLGNRVVVLAEQLVVCIHQLTLTHSGGGLFGQDVFRPLPQSQLAHAHADGAGGNQYQLMSGIFNVTHDLAQLLHPADIQMAGGVRKSRCADFDYNAHLRSLPEFLGYYITLVR